MTRFISCDAYDEHVVLPIENNALAQTSDQRFFNRIALFSWKLAGLGMHGHVDVALIWKPDYDALYYKQLCKRARRLFLFRSKYIFDLKTAVVLETPHSVMRLLFSRSPSTSPNLWLSMGASRGMTFAAIVATWLKARFLGRRGR